MDVKDSGGSPQAHADRVVGLARLDESQLTVVAAAEILTPTFGVTEQFLQVHSVALEAGAPQVAGVSIDEEQGSATVYFAVEGEQFYFAMAVSLTRLTVEAVWTEAWHRVTFHATSEKLDVAQLSALTSLQPTHVQHLGEVRDLRKWPYHAIEFEPSPGPGTFENKIHRLLAFLEQDAAGVQRLVDKAEGYIRVISVFHNGNTTLGGPHLNQESIRRLAALNLSVDFDLYAEGKLYAE